jgi:hypothetical protein
LAGVNRFHPQIVHLIRPDEIFLDSFPIR